MGVDVRDFNNPTIKLIHSTMQQWMSVKLEIKE